MLTGGLLLITTTVQVLNALDDINDEQKELEDHLRGRLDGIESVTTGLHKTMTVVLKAHDAMLKKMNLPTTHALALESNNTRAEFRRSLHVARGQLKASNIIKNAAEDDVGPVKQEVMLQLRCNHLKAMDQYGSSDPYVRLCLDVLDSDDALIGDNDQSTVLWESEVVKRDLNPIWEPTTLLINPTTSLVLQVWNMNRRGAPELVGALRTTIEELAASIGVEKSLVKLGSSKQMRSSVGTSTSPRDEQKETRSSPKSEHIGSLKVLCCKFKGADGQFGEERGVRRPTRKSADSIANPPPQNKPDEEKSLKKGVASLAESFLSPSKSNIKKAGTFLSSSKAKMPSATSSTEASMSRPLDPLVSTNF